MTWTFEPEPEPTDEELFWLLLPEILERMESACDQREAIQELVALSEEYEKTDHSRAWENEEEWADQAAEWLMAMQPAGTIWFNVEHDGEALKRVAENYQNVLPVKRVTNKSLRKKAK